MAFDLIDDTAIPTAPEAAPPAARSTGAQARVGVALAAAALTACGGGGSAVDSSAAPSIPGRSIKLSTTGHSYPSAASDEEAARFLLQAQLSASDADIAAVRSLGFAPWLEGQVGASLGTTGWDWLNSQGYGDVLSTKNYYDSSLQGDYMAWNQ